MKRPRKPSVFLEELSAAFHGGLGLGNLFVSYYNARKGNTWRAALHLGIAIFEGTCFHTHFKEVRNAANDRV